MKRISALFITLVLTLNLCACTAAQSEGQRAEGLQAPTWQEYYDLGVRYLSEGNYEEAIIAFTSAIKIDPKQAPAFVGRGDAYVLSGETEANLAAAKSDYEIAIELDETNAEAYLGLADVYIRQGDYEKALEILQEGLEKIGENQSISDKLAKIETVRISEMIESKDYSFLFTDDFVTPLDWTINGKRINECEMTDFQAEFPTDFTSPFRSSMPELNQEDFLYGPDKINGEGHVGRSNLHVRFSNISGTEYVNVSLSGECYKYPDQYPPEFYFQPTLRNIKTNDSFVEVLQKIGLTEAGIQYLEPMQEMSYIDSTDYLNEERVVLGFGYFAFYTGEYLDRTLTSTYFDGKTEEFFSIDFEFKDNELYGIRLSYH